MREHFANIAVLTNATAARQPSMSGYGRLMLKELNSTRHRFVELRAVSWAASKPSLGFGKASRNFDRFVLTPLTLVGKRTDILHVVDPGNAVYSPLIRTKNTIVTVHDMIPYLCAAGEMRGFEPSRWGVSLMRAMLRSLHAADRIIVPSKKTAEDLQRISSISASKIRVIPNALFQPMKRATLNAAVFIRQKYSLPLHAPLILHVGRNFYKNRETVLGVFGLVAAEHPEAHLVLVGALEPMVVAALARLESSSRVTVIDDVPELDLPSLYTAASVLLFPSIYEGFGYPVLEAQMCGTPVVCSDGGSLPEVAGQGALIRPVFDTAGLAYAVLAVIGEPGMTEQLAARGRANTARFSVEAWRDAHHNLYDELYQCP